METVWAVRQCIHEPGRLPSVMYNHNKEGGGTVYRDRERAMCTVMALKRVFLARDFRIEREDETGVELVNSEAVTVSLSAVEWKLCNN